MISDGIKYTYGDPLLLCSCCAATMPRVQMMLDNKRLLNLCIDCLRNHYEYTKRILEDSDSNTKKDAAAAQS